MISCAARLAPFDIDELREVMLYDELQLDELGDRKTAFFVIMSDTDSTYAFLIAMIMYQMFNLLCEKADNEYGGKLPFHVRCLFDEFANIGKVPDFHRLISTIRSRNISCMIILQSLTQISSIYKDDSETIIDCCDTFVFLGGKSTKTTKQISEMIGKTTIDTQNVNESRGQTGSYSLNNSILGRDLIDAAEIGRLKRTQCLVLITGLPPFKSLKYPTAKHMIVGTWKGTFDEWPTADSIYWSYTFSADGTYSFTNGTTTEAGTYTITSDPNNNYYHSSMQLTFDGGERTMQFYFTTTNPVKMITDDQTDPTYLKSLV